MSLQSKEAGKRMDRESEEIDIYLYLYLYINFPVLLFSACLMYSGCTIQQCQESILKLFGKSNIVGNIGR